MGYQYYDYADEKWRYRTSGPSSYLPPEVAARSIALRLSGRLAVTNGDCRAL